ncbi:MAG: hypothetical protein JOZ15_04080 [Acidobacteria bacterium]|nr:hypothetical protein [Acidobacteriota bacterium]
MIVMTHSNKNWEVMEQNKASFARHNPGVDILTPSFTSANLDAVGAVCPALRQLMEPCLHSDDLAWRYSDLLILAEFAKRPAGYEKWLYTEWDVYCAAPLAAVFKEVWDFDVAVTSIAMPYREIRWQWWSEVELLPAHLQEHACGITVLAATLFSSRALRAMLEALLCHPFHCFCELRAGTLANYVGCCPAVNPRLNNLSWQAVPNQSLRRGLIYHPIKRLLTPEELAATS